MDNDVNSMAIAMLAAKKAGGGSSESIIDDTQSSENTTYSSDKIDDLLNSRNIATVSFNIYPFSSPTVSFPDGMSREDFFSKVVTWNEKRPDRLIICKVAYVSSGDLQLANVALQSQTWEYASGAKYIIFGGVAPAYINNVKVAIKVWIRIGRTSDLDSIHYETIDWPEVAS